MQLPVSAADSALRRPIDSQDMAVRPRVDFRAERRLCSGALPALAMYGRRSLEAEGIAGLTRRLIAVDITTCFPATDG